MFRTLRSKLIFSYLVVTLLCLFLAVAGTLALARDYAERAGYTTLEEKWALVMPLLRTALASEDQSQSSDTGTSLPYDVMLAQPEPRLLSGLLGSLRDALFPALALAILVSLGVAYLLARSIARPITRLATATAALAKGDY